MKKIGIVITDGVGFRNFVLSDFLKEAESHFDEVVIFSCLPAIVFEGLSKKAKIIELTVFNEKFITWFFRKIKEIAHLQLHKKSNFGIQDNLNASFSKSNSVRGLATYLTYIWTSFFHSENWIQSYNWLQQFSFKQNKVTKEYSKLLQNEAVDILFFTHQRPSFIAPLIYAAEKLKIKTTAFIFSWDNLASKNRMAGNFDYYLVWSDLMQSELMHFYTKIKSEHIEVVGTPQFEPYVLEQYQTTKEAFFKKFGLDSLKKTICFSCGDISTSKNDELYIQIIANAIKSNTIEEVNFIVRTSPAEDAIRFAALVEQYPFIHWNFPDWSLTREGHQEVWSQRVPTIEDVKDLRALIEYCDLNINMLSTMSLDFMQFDKPVINTVFGNSSNGLYNDQRFLQYAHIVNVVNSHSTKIATKEEELITAINQYLNNPVLDAENRKQFNQLQVGKPLKETSKRIAEQLKIWANQ
jgi:hypothetical protein